MQPRVAEATVNFLSSSDSDLIFLFLIHEGEFLVWLPWSSRPGSVWASESWAALLQDA